ncbi:unnamed protein product, partial [Adineta steineri]
FKLQVKMPSGKTNSACTTKKRQRKSSSVSRSNEQNNNDHDDNQMLVEHSEFLYSSFNQPSSHTNDTSTPCPAIDPPIQNSTTHQPSSMLLSQLNNNSQ